MIDLTTSELIGLGNERACYRHPDDRTKVIKVQRPGRPGRQQNRIDRFYLASLERRGVPALHVPRQYGMVTTTLGEGLLLDYIVDADGEVAPTMRLLLETTRITPEEARGMLAELYLHLWMHGVAMVDISLANLVCPRTEGRRRAVVIDGLGGRYFDVKLWLRARYPSLGRRKLRAQWPKWEAQLRRLVDAPLLPSLASPPVD